MVGVLSRPSAGSSLKRIGRDLPQPFNRHSNRGSVLEENWRGLAESKSQKSGFKHACVTGAKATAHTLKSLPKKRIKGRQQTMKCERCVKAEEAQYRARSDVIDMKVCGPCAAEGSRLGLTIEALDPLYPSLSHLGYFDRKLDPVDRVMFRNF